MKSIRLFLVCVLWGMVAAAQTSMPTPDAPRQVSICELGAHPELYDKQLVDVQGALSIGFENFTLRDSQCHSPGKLSRIWLNYGGSKSVLGSRENPETPLVRDSVYEEFQNDIHAFRPKKPD